MKVLLDKEAFEKLYREHAPYALRVALLVIGNQHLAADAVQETFVRVYINLSKFDEERPFKPWFYKILINECNRILSKNKKIIYIEDYSESIMSRTGDMESAIENQEVCAALSKLDDKIRAPLVLKYIHGFTAPEISEIMDINVHTIKSRLNFGKEKLRKLLDRFYGEVI